MRTCAGLKAAAASQAAHAAQTETRVSQPREHPFFRLPSVFAVRSQRSALSLSLSLSLCAPQPFDVSHKPVTLAASGTVSNGKPVQRSPLRGTRRGVFCKQAEEGAPFL